MPLKISRILHAGYVFECDGTQIAFDPIFENPFSRNCHAFPDVRFDHARIGELRLAAVFISHYHDDHCSFDSLDLLDRRTPIYLYCLFEELFDMLRELGFETVIQLKTNSGVTVGPFEVIPRLAFDAEVDSMFQVRAAGLNVLNVVDSWIDPSALPELARYAPWDMVLWPFQTMRELAVLAPTRAQPAPTCLPEDWIDELRVLDPRFVVPSSCQFEQEPWSWYNRAFFPISYRQFQTEVEAALPATRVVRLNPSVSVELDENGLSMPAPLSWVLPVGPQDVDYAYDPNVVPPSTAEIARHFAPLTAPQSELVLAYCRVGLMEKYRSMELPEDSYFETARRWRLSLYDECGEVTRFVYAIEGDAISLCEADEGPVSWCTDVPAAKVYAALALGESLTSMYVRINEAKFDPATEAELDDADIVDDPLVRCLFNDVFGAYQAAQLRRLRAR